MLKIFVILFVLFGAALAGVIGQDEYLACRNDCLAKKFEPVCGVLKTRADTYYNECEMQCDKAEVKHPGRCSYEDLLKNKQTK